MYNSFIYIWFNKVKRKFYLGKHSGLIDDGYICSSKIMKIDYNRNPEHFKRRILSYVYDIDGSQILDEELKWLSMIEDSELGKKYYNLKNKNFGNTRGCKKSYVWNKGLTKDEQTHYLEMRRLKLFCLLSEKPKRGMLYRPLLNFKCKNCGVTFQSKQEPIYCSISCNTKWNMANGGAKKISEALTGRVAWNKGLPNNKASENGKKSALKQSETVRGRRIEIINGKRKWVYPEKD